MSLRGSELEPPEAPVPGSWDQAGTGPTGEQTPLQRSSLLLPLLHFKCNKIIPDLLFHARRIFGTGAAPPGPGDGANFRVKQGNSRVQSSHVPRRKVRFQLGAEPARPTWPQQPVGTAGLLQRLKWPFCE